MAMRRRLIRIVVAVFMSGLIVSGLRAIQAA
jgi:hypothetical protein